VAKYPSHLLLTCRSWIDVSTQTITGCCCYSYYWHTITSSIDTAGHYWSAISWSKTSSSPI